MINVVIPMAGNGTRFINAGYKTPKPFIDVLGKPMILRILENLKIDNAKYILLTRSEHLNTNKKTIAEILDNYNTEIISIDKLTEGATCTILFAHRLINNDTPLLIANSDQIIDIDINDYINDSKNRKLDGSVLCFEDNDNKWSYAKVDTNGYIEEIKEKVVISKNATVGIYYFEKGSYFVNSAIDMIINNDRVNGEFYTAPVYNWAIAKNLHFGIFSIDKDKMHGIGTPEDLNKYIKESIK